LRAFKGFYGAGERNVAHIGKAFGSLDLRVFLGRTMRLTHGSRPRDIDRLEGP